MTINVTLEWKTTFHSEKEYNQFISDIADIHAQRYGTNVVKSSLIQNNQYTGKTNSIIVKTTKE